MSVATISAGTPYFFGISMNITTATAKEAPECPEGKEKSDCAPYYPVKPLDHLVRSCSGNNVFENDVVYKKSHRKGA